MVSANKFDCHSPAPVQKPYKCKEAPARNTVTTVEQFRATGNVTGKKRGRSKPRVRTPYTVGTIRASVGSSPTRKSVRQLAAENEISPSTAWPILRTDLRMHPYKIHVFQSLTTVCQEKRTRFAGEFGDHLKQNPHTLEHICFSDEAYFHLTGDINRQNVLPELCLNWRRGSGKVVHRSQEECPPVLYRTLYYVSKRFESPKGLTSSQSSTTLPICEIRILVCYFDAVFIYINSLSPMHS
jgi:hypothetical protein